MGGCPESFLAALGNARPPQASHGRTGSHCDVARKRSGKRVKAMGRDVQGNQANSRWSERPDAERCPVIFRPIMSDGDNLRYTTNTNLIARKKCRRDAPQEHRGD